MQSTAITSLNLPSALAASGGDVRAHIDELNARAWAERFTDPQHALKLAQEAGRLAAEEVYRPGLAASLRNRGACKSILSECEAAVHSLQAALEMFRTLGDRVGEASALKWMGSTRRRVGDLAGALRLQMEALLIQRELRDHQGESDTLLGFSHVHVQLGNYGQALQDAHAALRIKEELGDQSRTADCLNTVGSIYGLLGEHDLALEHFQRSLELYRAAGDTRSIGGMLNNIAITYKELGLLDAAMEYATRALSHFRSFGDRRNEATALENLGEIHRALGGHTAALELFEQALAISRALGARYEELSALVNLGKTLGALDDSARAVRHLEEAVQIASEIGARQLLLDAYRALSRVHESVGDVAEAFRCYKAFHAMETEVFGQQADQKVRAVVVKAEVEKAQHEAELLRQKNDELAALNHAMETADREKTDLLAELERQTREDALTGLYNRRYLDAALAAELERARRFGRDLTVAMADVDRFKDVNDCFSHAVGDAVLRQVGVLLREGLRAVDVVARYGGEEFALLLVETPVENAAVVCERLRAAVEGFDWAAIHPELRVTLSLGLASGRGAAGPDALLAAADARLYEAKRAGRNRVCA